MFDFMIIGTAKIISGDLTVKKVSRAIHTSSTFSERWMKTAHLSMSEASTRRQGRNSTVCSCVVMTWNRNEQKY
jgi:hypothetical protein